MRLLDATTGEFSEVGNVIDVSPIKESITQTFEVGYKGLLGKKLIVAADGYYTKINDFVGPLIIETPNIFLDPATLAATLGQQFGTALAQPGNALVNLTLIAALDPPGKWRKWERFGSG